MNTRTLCLGILSLKEASGYELKKEIEEGMFRHFIDASFGSIYPALTQMSAEGLLTVRAEEQSGRPDKKVYAITEAGRAALAKGLAVIPARDKYKSEFLFEMLLQHLLNKEQVDLAISKQHADLTEDLGAIMEARAHKGGECNDPGSRFVMGYGECVVRAALGFLEAQCPWLRKNKIKAAE
ncbi:MAG: PadR family transcriptional regulator [Alphaproteobacteria bacterium]|nr:PadR family transcriptional regulator [Alphaproteobacteria bacterium]